MEVRGDRDRYRDGQNFDRETQQSGKCSRLMTRVGGEEERCRLKTSALLDTNGREDSRASTNKIERRSGPHGSPRRTAWISFARSVRAETRSASDVSSVFTPSIEDRGASGQCQCFVLDRDQDALRLASLRLKREIRTVDGVDYDERKSKIGSELLVWIYIDCTVAHSRSRNSVGAMPSDTLSRNIGLSSGPMEARIVISFH